MKHKKSFLKKKLRLDISNISVMKISSAYSKTNPILFSPYIL